MSETKSFSTVLNEYIKQIHCSSKELSEASGLSETSISRYRSGERIPDSAGRQMTDLVKGLSLLAKQRNIPGFEENVLLHTLQELVPTVDLEYHTIINHLNLLLDLFKIKSSDLAKALNYDSSYISRIRKGQRKPSHLINFIDQTCNYIERHYDQEDAKNKIATLIGCSYEELTTCEDFHSQLMHWFHQPLSISPNNVGNFLQKINEFNLEEYIDAIHFNDIKLPKVPFQLHTSRNYYGLEQIREGELDFLKSTVLSKSTEAVTMCSDMPMEEMAKDLDFAKKWMFGLAVVLKKGLHIRIIHNLNRPFNELMLGLESWIPLYMTGLVESYYFKKPQNEVYGHLNYTSGDVALYGECIQGHHNDVHYYFTMKSDEVNFYKKKTQYLIEKASPLIKIYTNNEKSEFHRLLLDLMENSTPIHRLSTSLPLYTIPDDLLKKIIQRNNCSKSHQRIITEYITKQKKLFEKHLEHSLVSEEIKFFDKNDFEQASPFLVFSELLCPELTEKFYYTYDEYQQHKEATIEYAIQHPNFHLTESKRNPFRNIDITIYGDNYAIVSKNLHPTIHFTTAHPTLLSAIKNIVIAKQEDAFSAIV